MMVFAQPGENIQHRVIWYVHLCVLTLNKQSLCPADMYYAQHDELRIQLAAAKRKLQAIFLIVDTKVKYRLGYTPLRLFPYKELCA
jgi:hypothetical protein